MSQLIQPVMRLRRFSARNGTKSGQIQVIFGPMFSGKSTELIRRLKRYEIANYSCLIVKYANDVRYSSESIATHDKQTLRAVSATVLSALTRKIQEADYDIIGIDEGQFFPDIVEFSEQMANEGRTVIVAALDGTFQRQQFGNILQLVPLAEHVVKLSAVCMVCFSDGSYTKRTSDDKEVEVIGGAEKYMAVCRKCFFSEQVRTQGGPRTPFHCITNSSDSKISPPKRSLMELK